MMKSILIVICLMLSFHLCAYDELMYGGTTFDHPSNIKNNIKGFGNKFMNTTLYTKPFSDEICRKLVGKYFTQIFLGRNSVYEDTTIEVKSQCDNKLIEVDIKNELLKMNKSYSLSFEQISLTKGEEMIVFKGDKFFMKAGLFNKREIGRAFFKDDEGRIFGTSIIFKYPSSGKR